MAKKKVILATPEEDRIWHNTYCAALQCPMWGMKWDAGGKIAIHRDIARWSAEMADYAIRRLRGEFNNDDDKDEESICCTKDGD